jgi:hypothetical protein
VAIPNGYALPFSGYDPHPEIPGAYSFTPASGGNPILASGPEAERMRALIDRAPKPPDMRTAMAPPEGPGISFSTPDTGQPAIGTQEPARTGTTTVEHIEPPPAPAPAPAPVAMPMAPNPTQGAATPDGELPPLPGVTPLGAAATPPTPTFEPSLTKRVAGVDPHRMAANAVAVPTTQSIQTEGGIQDPALRAQMVDLGSKQIEAQAAQAEVGKQVAQQQYEQASADKAIATADKLAAIDQAGRASAAMDLVKQRGAQLVQHAQQDLDAENAKKVDQYALFKGNPGGQIMAMIGVALGQFGAAIGNTQNIALQQLNKQVDENIQEQREAIARGVAGKSNDLRRIMDQYNLDRDDATNVLKLAYQKKIDSAAAERAALLGTQQAKLQYAAIQPKLMQEQANTMSKVNSDLLGKVQINQQSKMVQPSAGGVRQKTEEEITKEYELKARQEKAKNAIGHGGIAVKEAPGKTPGEITPNLSRAYVSTENALEVLHELRRKVTTQSPVSRLGEKIGRVGADTDIAALANHGANAVAGMEANGMAPDVRRVEELEHNLSSMNPKQQMAHINALIDLAEKKQKAIKETSAKTAKVGTITGDTGGGRAEGGEE